MKSDDWKREAFDQYQEIIQEDPEYKELLSQTAAAISTFQKTLSEEQAISFLKIEAMLAQMNARAQVIICTLEHTLSI